jgi:hypothetical protein
MVSCLLVPPACRRVETQPVSTWSARRTNDLDIGEDRRTLAGERMSVQVMSIPSSSCPIPARGRSDLPWCTGFDPGD